MRMISTTLSSESDTRSCNVPCRLVLFLTAAFLLLLLAGGTPAAGAAADRSMVLADDRLQGRHSLQVRAQSLRQFVRDASDRSGVRLEVAKNVAEEKITLFTKNESLRDSLNAVADLLELRWIQDRSKYVLTRDLAVWKRDAALCRAQLDALFKALDEKLVRSVALMDRSPADLQAERERVQTRMRQADEAARASLQEQLATIDMMKDPLAYPCLALSRRLSQAQWEALREGLELSLSSRTSVRSQSLPMDLVRLFQRSRTELPQQVQATLGDEAERYIDVKLRVMTYPPGNPQVARFECDVITLAPSLQHSYFRSWNLAVSRVASGLGIANESRSTGNVLRKAPTLPDGVRLELKPYRRRYGRLIVETSGRTIEDLVAALHAATGRNIVADAFTKPDFRVQQRSPASVAEYVDAACASVGYAWFEREGYLCFRSLSYYCDRALEVPPSLLDRWRERVGSAGKLSLDDMESICGSLTDGQLDMLCRFWPAHFGGRWVPWPSPDFLLRHRQHFRWHRSLSREQQARLQTGQALSWAQLRSDQRELLLRGLTSVRDGIVARSTSPNPQSQFDLRPESLHRIQFKMRREEQPVHFIGEATGRGVQGLVGEIGRAVAAGSAIGREDRNVLESGKQTVLSFVFLIPNQAGRLLGTETKILTEIRGPFRIVSSGDER